ncbi:MAG: M15 family metallopeptidase [Eubacteriales bacterium]
MRRTEWIKIRNLLKRYRRKKRWTTKKNVIFRLIFIIILFILAVVIAIKIVSDEAIGFVRTDLDSQVAGVTSEQIDTDTPAASFNKKKAEGFLMLVNWEHPLTSDKRPDGMVKMGTVFEKGLVALNEHASINEVAGEAANEMFKAAKEDGVTQFIITSAYRSVSYQDTLYQEKLNEDKNYGSDPYTNPVKVMPGNCTEHATGLAIDILAEDYKEADDDYDETEQGKWLKNNAYKFGFILRYPENKEHITGVIYEPWHYRYVGVEAAREMYEMGLCLEEYVYVP